MLATTGSAAPFIGLFGTVWGIMEAFAHINPNENLHLGSTSYCRGARRNGNWASRRHPSGHCLQLLCETDPALTD